MQCPNDGETLVMTERNGVEIDYCPKCRGVWLDRGELDKIIERSSQVPQNKPSYGPGDQSSRYKEGDYKHREGDYKHRKKKDSFLGDLFDF